MEGTQSHLVSMQGENAKVVLHEREVTLWEVRCYLYDVQSTNDEHLEKLPLYRPPKVTSCGCEVEMPKLSCVLHEVTLCSGGDTKSPRVHAR